MWSIYDRLSWIKKRWMELFFNWKKVAVVDCGTHGGFTTAKPKFYSKKNLAGGKWKLTAIRLMKCHTNSNSAELTISLDQVGVRGWTRRHSSLTVSTILWCSLKYRLLYSLKNQTLKLLHISCLHIFGPTLLIYDVVITLTSRTEFNSNPTQIPIDSGYPQGTERYDRNCAQTNTPVQLKQDTR